MVNLISITAAVFCVVMVVLPLFNRYLPRWACFKMGWHVEPKNQGFDGASKTGECPRCGKKVLQDSQGNWF